MKCSKCSNPIYPAKAFLTIKGSDKSLTLKVDAYKCTNCNKFSYDRETISKLESIRLMLTTQVYPV